MDTGAQDPETPKVIQLADGFFVRQEVDNLAWLRLDAGVLVVDALEKPELEAEVFRLIETTLPGLPVTHVLNTHLHYDHVALNAAFQRRWGAQIVNAKSATVPPEGLRFGGATRSVWFVPLPGCHTADDCIVWMPEDRILFPGDIFGWGLIPYDRPLTADKAAQLRAGYRRMLALEPRVVVPGHGPLCGPPELQRWLDYFDWAIATVKAKCAEGLTDAAIVGGAVPPPEDMHGWWRFLRWKHLDTVKKILHAVRRDRL